MTETTEVKYPSGYEVLEWMRQTLKSMPGHTYPTHMYRALSSMNRPMFDYLSERVGDRFPLRKTHMEFEEGDSFQRFINQVDTCD